MRLSHILRLTLGFKGLRHVADILPSPLPRKSRKKLFALRTFMKSIMLRLAFRFIQFLPSELIKQISFYLCFRGKGHYIWFLFEKSICGVTRRRGIFLGSDLYSQLESTLTCSQLNLACVVVRQNPVARQNCRYFEVILAVFQISIWLKHCKLSGTAPLDPT